MKKTLVVAILALGALVLAPGRATEANHGHWGGYASVGHGGFWQAGLYHYQGRTWRPGLWIGGYHFPTAPDFNWHQRIWTLGERGYWQSNQYHWQDNWYRAPLYQGGHFFPQAPRQFWQNQCQWRYNQCYGWQQNCQPVLIYEPHHCNRWCQPSRSW